MIYEIITLALFAVWFTSWFEPLNTIREWFTDIWVRACIKAGFSSLSSLAIVINCPKCFGFWFTLFYKQDFFLALSVSFVGFLINFIIDKITWEYEK